MGRLIIDGDSVFEIDEECLKRRIPDKSCEIEKYMDVDMESSKKINHVNEKTYKSIK